MKARVIGAAAALWRRFRKEPLPLVSQSVECPLHHCPADVTARTAPDARPGARHVSIVACSLLPDAAFGLPERRAYLADAPPCDVVLEAAPTHPVYATGVSCRQPCVHVLNAAASPVPPRPLACASGVSDGIELMRQVDRSAGRQALWFNSW